MAYISKRTLASGKRAYLVRWVDPDGRETSEQFSGSGAWDAAKAKKSQVEQELRNGSYVDSQAGRIKFRDYAAQWLDNQISRETTRINYERNLRLHINPAFGNRSIATIRRSDVLALVKTLNATHAPNSVRAVVELAAAIFNAAVFDRLIARTPVERIPLPRVAPSSLVVPTVEQVYAIANDVPANLHHMMLVAASTGLRLGELLGVTLESVNFLAREVTVHPERGQLIRVRGAGTVLAPPKSSASARTVPLGDVALTALAERLRVRPANPDDGFGGLVFQNNYRRGGPVTNSYVHEHLAPAMRRQGFPPRTGMHIFRHFYASALIAGGESPKVVQARLGHATITETMDTYGHLWPDSDTSSRRAIDAAFGLRDVTLTVATSVPAP